VVPSQFTDKDMWPHERAEGRPHNTGENRILHLTSFCIQELGFLPSIHRTRKGGGCCIQNEISLHRRLHHGDNIREGRVFMIMDISILSSTSLRHLEIQNSLKPRDL
jgi:hypothetical protein